MSKPENTLAGKPLPSPRSPAHLDERIIAQARAALPPAKPVYQPWWLAGSATAAVVVLAVTLSVTNYPAFTPSVYEQPSTESSEILISPEYGTEAEPTSIKSHAAQAIMQSAPKHEKKMLAKLKAFPATARLSLEEVETFALNSAPAESAMDDKILEGERVVKRLPEKVLKSLQALAEFDTSSDPKYVSQQYEKLKISCSECDLPQTLDEAIAEHLAPQR